MTELVLGLDGGGTSTTVWLSERSGSILGRGRSGPSNVKAIGPEAAKSAIDLAIARAFADASIGRQSVTIACLGLAGFDRAEEKNLLESWSAAERWAKRLLLVNDGDLVVAAGTRDGWGVGLIAGTGSIAVGQSGDGRKARAGGWGYLLGDEGSAYQVALAGLRKVARRGDGRETATLDPDDRLSRLLCAKLAIESPSALVSAIYRPEFDRAMIASLAPSVVEAAGADPSIVEEVLEPAGSDLARMVVAVAQRIGIDEGRLPLAKAGSFLLNCEVVSNIVDDRLARAGYLVECSTVPDPVAGALILAKRALIS